MVYIICRSSFFMPFLFQLVTKGYNVNRNVTFMQYFSDINNNVE